ncbi:MAG TPA: LON peptidase substrate-binding domain-containing protein [Chloroflexota bacterium]|nr:LON peptidase substrate-binding domain-containing protein [Chloroflexota bacterium]
MAGELQDIPLFPLGAVVLFPGMALPLHVFEERYKQMVGRCLATNEGFGVVLIREGREVGAPAEPFEVGTVARIASVERLPDGRMNLVTVGTRRFRCVEHVQVEPYRIARVEWLDDPPAGDEIGALAGEVRAAVEEYLQAVYALAERPRRAIEFPDDVALLSFQVGAVLQIAPQERQRLLETTATDARLRQELAYLRRETRLLQLLLSRRDSGNAGKFSRN